MSLGTVGLLILLAVWFVLSVLNQFGTRSVDRLRRVDPLQLLPLWNFFAPHPGVHDYYLLYREESESGELGSWHLVHPTQSRSWTSCLWNPDKLGHKTLSDLTQILAGYQDSSLREGPSRMLTLPYLVCLNVITDARPHSRASVRQFVLARKRGLVSGDELLPILVSDLHRV